MEQAGYASPAFVGRTRWYRDGCFRHVARHVGMHDHGTGPCGGECRGIAAIMKEADLLRTSGIERRHPGQHQIRLRR